MKYKLVDKIGAGIIHRDFKPSNLLWQERGNQIKVCDFGLSILKESEIVEKPKGTPLYFSPEIFEHKGENVPTRDGKEDFFFSN